MRNNPKRSPHSHSANYRNPVTSQAFYTLSPIQLQTTEVATMKNILITLAITLVIAVLALSLKQSYVQTSQGNHISAKQSQSLLLAEGGDGWGGG